MTITNLFGELANDLSIKNLMQKFGRFSFDGSSQLRVVAGGGTLSTVSSVTTVGFVSQANMSIGDMGRAATVQMQSAQGFYGSVGANFVRS